MGSPSLDHLRLLHILHRFTVANGGGGKGRWIKDLPLAILVYHGIDAGLFTDYDWAPSLVEFHGVKMYGKVSQEAYADLRRLQTDRFIEKLHLSTCLYDSIRAYRATGKASEALQSLPDDDRAAIDALLNCGHCGTLHEVLAYVERSNGHWGHVRNATVAYCPSCCTVQRNGGGPVISTANGAASARIDFFDIADVVYRTRPTTLGGFG